MESVTGWGVFALPLSSGHVLALRVFPEGTFTPYVSVWHRDPAGRWSIYVDGEDLGTACPRYFGPACHRTAFARITVTGTGRTGLRVQVDEPALDWRLKAHAPPSLRLLNAVGRHLPAWTWRPAALLRLRELAARWLGIGDLRLRGTMPSGHTGLLMPEQMFLVDEATAVLDGVDLGHPVRLPECPTIGDVPLPARGVLATGSGAWTSGARVSPSG